ncbi:ComF family protein [bacterium]|nr:ComF family protein [bacterium]
MTFLSGFFTAVVEFIFPPFCMLCGGQLNLNDKLVCRSCLSDLKKVEGIVQDGVIDFDCIDEIRAGAYYDQKLQTLIHHFKYQRALALADAFADILSPIIRENAPWCTSDLLIPVPLHKVKFRERSFNQSEEIAKALSCKVDIPCSTDVLLRRANTESQTQMADAQERVKNMANVFVVKNSNTVKGKTVILIDDLITTGSTANACARVLKQHGAQRVYVLTVGRPYF